ncbi:MAG: hypothetical protein Q8P67_20470, partial [archaeon]|nr:hypothetical protein [archaeon]
MIGHPAPGFPIIPKSKKSRKVIHITKKEEEQEQEEIAEIFGVSFGHNKIILISCFSFSLS